MLLFVMIITLYPTRIHQQQQFGGHLIRVLFFISPSTRYFSVPLTVGEEVEANGDVEINNNVAAHVLKEECLLY